MYESLYVHIPFCKQRCAYCDFSTDAASQDDPRMDAYLEFLIRDIRALTRAGELEHIRTLYLGGGTPTHFGHSRLVELAYTLSLSIRLEQVEEYTVEANPESLTPALVKDLYALGVGRLSLGVQSLVDSELVTLGRVHDAEQAIQAVQCARERFGNLSLDLICGIPGQTTESWQFSLDQALQLQPEHLSIYPLQIEEGTSLAQAVARGELPHGDDDEQAEFLLQAASTLQAAGYQRYEVASYAKPGKESKHNCRYWMGISYLGIGCGAASMLNKQDGTRERWRNGDAQELNGETKGHCIKEEQELLSASEAAAEDLLLGMRMSRGISAQQLSQVAPLLPQAKDLFEELQQLDLLAYRENCYRPTEKGWLLGNELYQRIWGLTTRTAGQAEGGE